MGIGPSRGIGNKNSDKVNKDAISYNRISLLGVRSYKVNEMTDLP